MPDDTPPERAWQLQDIREQIEAVERAHRSTLDPDGRVRLKRRLDDLYEEMAAVERGERRPAARASNLTPQERRNRTAMLDKVQSFWVKGVLNQSLYREARLDLGLADAPDAVEYPWHNVIQRPDQPERTLAPGTPLIQVFDELNGSLLILGQPGAGKTTLLLELARDLIARARADDTHPIPVVFNLSTWAAERKPLRDWLVEELRLRYDVPRRVGEAWVAADAILPLLDGLDEVAEEHRDTCVTAINAFEAIAPRAVCSRVEDYEQLNAKLKLQGAVVIQLLDDQQVDAYLATLGEPVIGIREAVREGAEWRELLDTPLMLVVVVLAFRGRPADQLQQAASVEGLWNAYIERMFTRKGENTKRPREKVERALKWLAWQMRERQKTVFYCFDTMRTDWLSVNWQRMLAIAKKYMAVIPVFMAYIVLLLGYLGICHFLLAVIVASGFVGLSIALFAFNLMEWLVDGLIVVVVVGLISWVIYGRDGAWTNALLVSVGLLATTRISSYILRLRTVFRDYVIDGIVRRILARDGLLPFRKGLGKSKTSRTTYSSCQIDLEAACSN